jgi:hypothetical protein
MSCMCFQLVTWDLYRSRGLCLAHSGISNSEYCISCYEKMDGKSGRARRGHDLEQAPIPSLSSTMGGDKPPEYGDDPSSAKLVVRDNSGQ